MCAFAHEKWLFHPGGSSTGKAAGARYHCRHRPRRHHHYHGHFKCQSHENCAHTSTTQLQSDSACEVPSPSTPPAVPQVPLFGGCQQKVLSKQVNNPLGLDGNLWISSSLQLWLVMYLYLKSLDPSPETGLVENISLAEFAFELSLTLQVSLVRSQGTD